MQNKGTYKETTPGFKMESCATEKSNCLNHGENERTLPKDAINGSSIEACVTEKSIFISNDKRKILLSRDESISSSKGPPDGGFRAYSVVAAAFICNGLVFGVINSYGIVYAVLQKNLELDGVKNSQARASLVGALSMGMTFLMSPVSGALTGLMGLRLTAVVGGCVATGGLLLSSCCVGDVDALCFTYGVMYGLGASLVYTPSLAILGHYFKKYLGLANGVVTIGSSVFTVIISSVMQYTVNNHPFEWTFRVLAALTSGLVLCAFIFKPIAVVDVNENEMPKTLLKKIFDVEIWRNRQYTCWALSFPLALFGYFVPYVHMSKYIALQFPEHSQTIPVQSIAVTSGIGRLFFGYVADRPRVNRVLIQQIALYMIGAVTILLPFLQHYWMLVCAALLMGVFDGAFISLIGPIAIQLCGSARAAQAIGCIFGLTAVPLSVGPPVAGHLYEVSRSYTTSFVLAGLSPVLGATAMFAAACCARPRPALNGKAKLDGRAENGNATQQSTL